MPPSTADAPMRFGCCAPPDRAEAVARAGFDFIECPAASTLHANDERSDFSPDALRHLPLPVEAFNIFLPGDLKIVGPSLDRDRIRRYLQRVLERAGQAGAMIMVFGSGRSRNVPDDVPREEARTQIRQFLTEASLLAGRNGVTLVIEPLNKGESNIINSVPEALGFAQIVNHPNLQVLADLYHITLDDESLDNLSLAKGRLGHVHVADTGRYAPGSGEYETLGLFRRLKEIDYEGRVSIECTWRDFETEAPAALAFLRKTWQQA